MLTTSDIRLIKNLLSVKTDDDIAQILGKPIEEVRRKINEMTSFKAQRKRRTMAAAIIESNMRYSHERALQKQEKKIKRQRAEERWQEEKQWKEEAKAKKALARESRLLEKEQKKRERQEAAAKAVAHKKKKVARTSVATASWASRPKKIEKAFETKALDYSQMKLIKIDSRTAIYIPINSNPETERKKYLSKRK